MSSNLGFGKKQKPKPKEERINVDDLDIDPTNLDLEWQKQPKLYYLASLELADSRAEVDRLKSLCDVVEAEVQKKVLANPARYDCENSTVAVVKAAVTREMSKKMCTVKLRKAKHRVDVVQAYVGGLDQKKRALEGHVSLFVHNYYSTPREPKGSHEYVETMRADRVHSQDRVGRTSKTKRKRQTK